MKITFISPHLKISGGVRIVLMYANLLAHKNHSVTVIVRSQNKLRRTVANIFQIGRPNWIRDFKPKVIRVEDVVEKNIPEADILLASSYRDILKTADLPLDKGEKFYLVQHDERLYHGDRDRVENGYLTDTNKIVVASWLKEMFKNEFNQEAVLLINPIDTNLFHPLDNKRQGNDVRILLMHHDYEWKGTKEGVKIVQKLKKKYPQIKLIIFGVRQEQIEYPSDEYYYKLPQNKLAELYSNCDIFLCPSWDEGFGLPSVEAMACRCALVTYDNGGSRDYAYDNKTAMVAKHRDINDLANKLEQLVKEKDLRGKIARQGYEFIQTMPTWQEQTDRLENIFKQILEKNA